MSASFSHSTLREDVALFLRNKILKGEIAPGMKINEVEIAAQLGISRGPVREALRQIEHEGFVSYTANKGCTVRTLSPDSMSEVYLLRSTLETLAVRVYEGKIRPESLEYLYAQCDALDRAGREHDLPEIVMADQQFHEIIVKEAGLEKLYRLWSTFDGENAATFHTMAKLNQMPYEWLDHNHRKIADVFRDGDLEAIIHSIETHYGVVPQLLYQANNQQPLEWLQRVFNDT